MAQRQKDQTSTGNSFRDLVATLLKTAGYDVETECLLGGKAVDIVAKKKVQFGNETLAIETKSYKQNLPLEQTFRFIEQYGSLTRDHFATRAILVTRKDLTPDGKTAISSNPNALSHYTWQNLQREIFGTDHYLKALIKEYHSSGLKQYYIKPKTKSGSDLTKLVYEWIAEALPPPLVILGTYGIGKTTFARALAAGLSSKCIEDPSARIPILVPLGEIADENSLEGLFGKLLTARYRIENYHFDTFLELNRLGRLVIIFDGLDEMKHGMTFPAFQRQCNRIFELHEGDSRLLLLGRPSAFPSEREFRAIIRGRITTSTGQKIDLLDRPHCRDIYIAGFTAGEAHSFVRNYFGWYAKTQNRSPNWIRRRMKLLQSGRFEKLIRRPIHAWMLCQIATDENEEIEKIDLFSLYHKFVTLLLHREILKSGRYAGFGISVRRAFNCAASWWLLSNGGSSATTITDIPDEMCERAVRGISHEFDSEGLKQELIKGCFIEKPTGEIYLNHQSVQDFLAAEFLFETVALSQGGWTTQGISDVCSRGSSEVANFLEQFFLRQPPGLKRAQEFGQVFADYRGDLEDGGYLPFVKAFRINPPIGFESKPWGFLLEYKAAKGAGTQEGISYLLKCLGAASTPIDIWLIVAQQLAVELSSNGIAPVTKVIEAALKERVKLVNGEIEPSIEAFCLKSALQYPERKSQTHKIMKTGRRFTARAPKERPLLPKAFSIQRFRSIAHKILGFGPVPIDIEKLESSFGDKLKLNEFSIELRSKLGFLNFAIDPDRLDTLARDAGLKI